MTIYLSTQYPNNNPANSEEIMTGSHITKVHTRKHKEPVTPELLNKVSNAPGAASKHNIGQGPQNPSNPQSTTSVDCELVTGKDKSFSSETVKNGGITEIMGETLNMMEEFINDMIS